jgi:predicted TIM-barrel fold metal-dependent hydrolase
VGIIDADTHVDESENTWASLEGTPYKKYISATVTIPPEECERPGLNPIRSRKWLVEGRVQSHAIRDEVNHPLRIRRELEDVAGRVSEMNQMGVDAQVIYPTFFIRYGTENPEAEEALTGAYNRWIADKRALTQGRLRWAAVLPWLRPEAAVKELRWAKENGACGIFKRGFDLNRDFSDPFAVYEEANALGLPLCIHTGHPHSAAANSNQFHC